MLYLDFGFKSKKFFLQFLVNILPPDPDPRSKNVADPKWSGFQALKVT